MIFAGPNCNINDRTAAWYLVDNVTTLSFAWYFTGDMKYANFGADLVNTWFLDPKTAMYPSLDYAQDGHRTGLIDWKDTFFLLDAIVLLETSGALRQSQVKALESWFVRLATWFASAHMAAAEGNSPNNHGLYFDLSCLAMALYGKNDELVDYARQRLHYRLAKLFPLGHFTSDGAQPHETKRPTALHYITFNLVGWVHIALIVESAIAKKDLPIGAESLWNCRHEGDKPTDPPVLLKALRWYVQWLPTDSDAYTKVTEPTKGMGIKFPFEMEDAFSFDRMLEILRYGVRVYGVRAIFTDDQLKSKAVQQALSFSFYATNTGMISKYSSISPDAGTRPWASLGVINHVNFTSSTDSSYTWYDPNRGKPTKSGKRRNRRNLRRRS